MTIFKYEFKNPLFEGCKGRYYEFIYGTIVANDPRQAQSYLNEVYKIDERGKGHLVNVATNVKFGIVWETS